MIEIVGVTKSFGATGVLDGIDLSVATGETVALLGPSGVGKSTLLRIIAGLEVADSGSIRLDGEELAGRPTHERGIGYMFQDLALFPHLDVAANIAFGLRMRGDRAVERSARVATLLELVGLPGAAERDPASLSGGERQRVALARALAPEPRALLLDEPFGALDRMLRDRLLVELRGVFVDLGLTVVAVTHDPAEAASLADRIAVMLDGRVAQAGAPGDLFGAPSSRSVAAALGLRNVVSATVDDPATPPATVSIEGWGSVRAEPHSRSGVVGVLVPKRAISATAPGSPAPAVAVVVESVVWRDGEAVTVVRPQAGGESLEAHLGASLRSGDRLDVVLDADDVRVLT